MFNFGGLGINRTMFAWYQVFAVDPRDPNHLFAPDIFDDRMKETWDGGDTWFDRSDLTALVTGSGTFLFHDSLFPQASAISFSEDDPHMVAVGTMQGGLFLSSDRGTTWDNVYGSDRATYITSISLPTRPARVRRKSGGQMHPRKASPAPTELRRSSKAGSSRTTSRSRTSSPD
jgi:hypothetical protein